MCVFSSQHASFDEGRQQFSQIFYCACSAPKTNFSQTKNTLALWWHSSGWPVQIAPDHPSHTALRWQWEILDLGGRKPMNIIPHVGERRKLCVKKSPQSRSRAAHLLRWHLQLFFKCDNRARHEKTHPILQTGHNNRAERNVDWKFRRCAQVSAVQQCGVVWNKKSRRKKNENVIWLLFLLASLSRLSSRDDENLKVFIFTNHEHENEDMS